MQALLIENQGVARVGEIAEPTMGSGDVLLQVRTIGFCGSDLNTYRGLNPLVGYPRVPGHEIAATVLRIGTDVPADEVSVGADVTVLPYTACGTCAACRRNRSNACQNNQTLGVQRNGALTERISVPWEKVIRADGLSIRQLALVEPLSVGFHAIARGRVASTDVVAVIGCGAVGLGAILGARARGARVIAVDVDDAKLALAKAWGATEALNTHPDSLPTRLRELLDGELADVVIEAVGLPSTFVAAVNATAFTGRVVYIGYAMSPVTYDTAQFVKKELDILGARNATIGDFNDVIAMLKKREFVTDLAVSRSVSLDDSGDALSDWSQDTRCVTRIHVEVS